MTRTDTNDFLAEQTASDTHPAHICRLVHAYRIGGDDFAIEVAADFPDVASDAERDALLARAKAIAADIGPIDLKTPGTLTLQRIAEVLGEAYWVPRSWVSQGAPHEGYGSEMRCDPAALAAWCEEKAVAIPAGRFPREVERFRGFAQRLSSAALQAA